MSQANMNVNEQNFSESQENLPESLNESEPVHQEEGEESLFHGDSSESGEEKEESLFHGDSSESGEEKEESLSHDENSPNGKSEKKDVKAKFNKKRTFEEPNRKQLYEAFLTELNALSDPEKKLRHIIDFMVSALATKHGAPYFKGFWDARTLAIQVFKENINPAVRAELWNKYAELSKEARRLKETLDEQSAFAAEQIEIAIKAIENDQQNPSTLAETSLANEMLLQNQTLKDSSKYYDTTQKELNLLNAHASRITALRKELIRMEMRVRQKNKFFQRLSALGDTIFPRRKDLIKEISQRFETDIDNFVKRYFSKEEYKEAIFFLRQEIKTLQSIAKYLTLNTQAFTYTRMRLSECWDKLKSSDKERKRQRAQHKVVYKENADLLHQKLSDVEKQWKESSKTSEEVQRVLDEIQGEMRLVELGRDEIKALRDHIGTIRQNVLDQAKIEEQQRIEQIQEKEKIKKFKLKELKNEINALLMDLESYDAKQLSTRKEEFLKRISEITATKQEKQELERLIKSIKEAIVEKKERDVLALSEDDRQAVEQLREILQQRKERRQEIKKNLEQLRKGSGGSGLDFEQAMNLNNLLTEEKERLDKISEGIKEIEDSIAQRLKTNSTPS